LAQQLLARGERVVDVQPKLAARVRLLSTGAVNKNDPNDARSVAVAALRARSLREVVAEDQTAVLRLWARRYRDLGSARTQLVCRLHAVLCELVPGGFAKEISAAQATVVLAELPARGEVDTARLEFA
jgi:transposase